MIGMVGHTETLLDEFSHPLGGPQLGGKTVGARTFLESRFQFLDLFRAEAGASPGLFGLAQSVPAPSEPVRVPATGRLAADLAATGDFGWAETFLEPLGGSPASLLEGIKITFLSFWKSHVTSDAAGTNIFTLFYRNQ